MKGKIKKFFADKGYGFIKTADGEYFFHIKTAQTAGLNESDLQKKNTEFEIEVGIGKKGKMEVKKFITSKSKFQQKNKDRIPHSKKSANIKQKKLSYNGNDRNFYLFLNKPYHVKEHNKMYAPKENGDTGFALSTRFSKEGNFPDLTNFDFSGVNCTTITNQQKSNTEAFFAHSKALLFKPEWRLTLGLGGASVFETDITLHHIYGVPYIPASSIKGVVRSYIITEFFGHQAPENEKDYPLVNAEFRAITTSENFCKIFGCPKEAKQVKFENGKPKKIKKGKKWIYDEKDPVESALGHERRGKITFFDALPTDSRKIHISMDIMNVHYKEYYESKNVEDKNGEKIYEEGSVKPPADWSNPSIINFLTVKNTTFQFLLASKDKPLNELKIGGKTIEQWLTEALTEHGIGAKTAVGYGYMQ